MSDVSALFAEARRLYKVGQAEAAYESCKKLLELDPTHDRALELSGVLASGLGDVRTAVEMLERAAAQRPADLRLLVNLGAAYKAAGRPDDAEARYREAIAIDPSFAPAHFNLANLLAARGATGAALREYAAAITLEPTDVGALNNIAALLKATGRHAEAEQTLRALIAAHPRDVAARNNLGVLCMTLGRVGEAIRLYHESIALDPKSATPRNNLGVALLEIGAYREAEHCLREALAVGQDVAELHENLGNVLRKLGETDAAAQCYRRARALGGKGGVAFKLATLLPTVAGSTEELARWRRRMELGVAELNAAPSRLDDPYVEAGVTAFNVSYHDCNNRDLQAALAQAYLKACPSLAFAAPHCSRQAHPSDGRLKIGFISRQFATNAVGWCFHGVLRHMQRDDISVTALRFGESDDPLWRGIAADVDATAILPAALEPARRQIAALGLDALIYTDIGMEPLTYFLAFARLAPLQCVLGGHPDTLGVPTIDFYLSCDLQEPPDAEAHYREKLIRLPGAPTYYDRPALPSPLKPRSAFGLPDDRPLYFCAQTLIKLHPDMDRLFAAILDRDPDGLLLLPTGYNPRLADHLRARFAASLGGHAGRVLFLPALSHMDFMNVLALADVSLDTRPFGGGNTSWQAIAAGTPIVTWPGRFLRGRYTQALYRMAGATDTVVDGADAYIDMALRVARDRDFRAAVQARVAAGADRIFSDRTHVDGMADTLRRLARA